MQPGPKRKTEISIRVAFGGGRNSSRAKKLKRNWRSAAMEEDAHSILLAPSMREQPGDMNDCEERGNVIFKYRALEWGRVKR